MIQTKQLEYKGLFERFACIRLLILCLFLLSITSSAYSLSGKLTPHRYGGSAISPWLDVTVDLDVDQPCTGKVECWLEPVDDHSEVPPRGDQVRSFEFSAESDGDWEESLSEQQQWFWLVGVAPPREWQVAGRVIVGDKTVMLSPVSLDPVGLGEAVVVQPDAEGSLGHQPFESGDLVRYRLVPDGEVQEVAIELGGRNVSSVYLGTAHDDVDIYLDAPEEGAFYTVKGCGDSVVQCSLAADDLAWLKTLEWNFSRSPVATGWEENGIEGDNSYITPWYHRDPTRLLSDKIEVSGEKPFIPERLQRLAIESKLDGKLVGGWKLQNLFRAPKTKEQQWLPGKNHRDQFQKFPNRLLRFDVILSADVSGDQIPVIQFCLSEGDEWYRYTLNGLFDKEGRPLEKGKPNRYTFYHAPPHHLSDYQPGPMDFEFVVCGEDGVSVEKSVVYLENLTVYETIIGDPSGETQQVVEQWPMASPFSVGKTIKSYDLPVNDFLFGVHTVRPAKTGGVETLVSFQTSQGIFPDEPLQGNVYQGPYYNGVLALSDQETRTEVLPWDPLHGSGVFGLQADISENSLLFYTGRDPLHQGDVQVQAFEGTDEWLQERIAPDHRFVSSKMPLGFMSVTLPGGDTQKSKSHAVWTADADEFTSSGVAVLHQSAAGSVFNIGKDESCQVIYQELNSDSGIPQLDAQNPTLLYDKQTDLYYLAVMKNCSYYPGHGFLSDFLVLDSAAKKIFLTDVPSGDRSVLKDLSRELNHPVAMIPKGGKQFQPSLHPERECWYDYTVLILDSAKGLMELDCLTGELSRYIFPSKRNLVLNTPREMVAVPNLFHGEDRWEGCLIAHEKGIALAEKTEDSTGEGQIADLLKLEQAANLEVHEYGIGRCREYFATKNHPQAFNIAAKRYGKPAVETGGDIYIYLLNSGVKNTPLSVWFHRDVDNLNFCVYLETDDKGQVVSTQNEVIQAVKESEKGSEFLKFSYDPALGDEIVLPQSKKLPGGLSGRKLFYTAPGPDSEYPVVWECNITDIHNPGKPFVVGRSAFAWNPISLVYYRHAVYILDGETNALYKMSLDEGPALVEREDAVLTDLSSPVSMEIHRGRAYLYLKDEIWSVDIKDCVSARKISNQFGHGEQYQTISSGFPVHWDVEENDGGVKIYWSQINEETGLLEPFTHDRYIGWLPYYDVEFFPSRWCGDEKGGAPWMLSVNNQPFDRKLNLMSVQTSPPGM